MSSNKQYGLQISKKNTHGMVQKHAAFGDDSESEKSDGGGTDWAKRAIKTGEKSTVKRQTKIEMQRALEQDSTVYQYDEVYDQLEKSKQDKHSEKEKKPKYIQKLLISAEKRKIENERRIERQVQKERETEGDEFKDKETFVTAAYKKKLEEFAKLDAEQKRQDMLEDIGDVTKQQDIGGFYRHLYQQTMSSPSEESPSKNIIPKEETESPKKDSSHRHSHQSAGNGHNDDKHPKSSTSREDKRMSNNKKSDYKKDRQYRKRKESESSVEKNKDADTDGDSSSSSSSSSSDSESGKSSHSETEDPKRIRSKEYSSTAEQVPLEQIPVSDIVVLQPVEPQKSIWEKRTVGPVFDAALKRYLERKSARMAVVS